MERNWRRSCVGNAVRKYRNLLAEGKTPHMIWIWPAYRMYVISKEEFPQKIYCHNGNRIVNPDLVQRILDSSFMAHPDGFIADYMYKDLKDKV